MMQIVFMGTPAIAASVLESVAARHDVVGVFTRPDAIRGRGNALVPSEVKVVAQSLGLEVYTPARLEDDSIETLAWLDPEMICVVAYGVILPEKVIELPKYGCLNVHASLLPRWRGAAPIERAILSGDEFTGVSIMLMDEGLDTGSYCEQRPIPIEGKNLATLEAEVAIEGSMALLEVIEALDQGNDPSWMPQDEASASYASKIEKGELDLDPFDSAFANARKVKASSEAHPARAVIAGRECTIGDVEQQDDSLSAGSVLWESKNLYLGCAEGRLLLEMLKPAGKRMMDAEAFAAGVRDLKSNTVTWERL